MRFKCLRWSCDFVALVYFDERKKDKCYSFVGTTTEHAAVVTNSRVKMELHVEKEYTDQRVGAAR